MSEPNAFYGSATVGAKGQIVIPADAHKAMQIEEGHKVVVLRGPRDGSIIAFRADSLDKLFEKATGQPELGRAPRSEARDCSRSPASPTRIASATAIALTGPRQP